MSREELRRRTTSGNGSFLQRARVHVDDDGGVEGVASGADEELWGAGSRG